MGEVYIKELIFFSLLDITIMFLLWKFKRISKLSKRELEKILGIAILSSILTAAVLTLMNICFGNTRAIAEYSNTSAALLSKTYSPFWITVVVSGISAPIIEEAMFRVGFFSLFEKIIHKDVPLHTLICVLGTNYFFARMHSGVVQSIYAAILGTVMSAIYLKQRKNAVAPIIFHSAFNMTSIILSYFITFLK